MVSCRYMKTLNVITLTKVGFEIELRKNCWLIDPKLYYIMYDINIYSNMIYLYVIILLLITNEAYLSWLPKY